MEIQVHHLPNVSTSEDTQNGRRTNVTELQVQLLEKVEEMTLYVLQQQERLVQQQTVIEKLHRRFDGYANSVSVAAD